MDSTAWQIAQNLHDVAWLREFAARSLSRFLHPIEKTYRYEKSDSDDGPTVDETDYLPERGVLLWSCDCGSEGSERNLSRKTKDYVLFESGNLYILSRCERSGFFRSDMEMYSSHRDRDIDSQHVMSRLDLIEHGPRIARQVFGLAVEQDKGFADVTHSNWEALTLPEVLALHLEEAVASKAAALVEGELRYFCLTENPGYKLVHEKSRDVHGWGSGGEKAYRISVADDSWQVVIVASICDRYHTESDDSTDHHIATDLSIRSTLGLDHRPLKAIVERLDGLRHRSASA